MKSFLSLVCFAAAIVGVIIGAITDALIIGTIGWLVEISRQLDDVLGRR